MEKKSKKKEQTMKTFLIKNIPEEVHRKFKVYCAQKENTMREELIRFMNKVVKQKEKL